MDTMFAQTATQSDSPIGRHWLTSALLAGILVVALVAAFVAEAALSTSNPAGAGGLTPQQIVTRGEVADRYGDAGLSPQQIVTRGEVADRYGVQGDTGLSPQQIVTRGEVADRYAK
jgi:hypothetical protein